MQTSVCAHAQELFSLDKNPNLNMEEFDAMLSEFRTDYNQTHFVRNETFKKAADSITGPARKIFIEFLERSCTAEFSGFLLYKELGRRLKKTNPVGARAHVCSPTPLGLLRCLQTCTSVHQSCCYKCARACCSSAVRTAWLFPFRPTVLGCGSWASCPLAPRRSTSAPLTL